MNRTLKKYTAFTLCFTLLITVFGWVPTTVQAKTTTPVVVILNAYGRTMDIGSEFRLIAIASNLSTPTFKSSKSSVASVNTYGVITAKKAGTAKITAKVSGGEASCTITVRKTKVTLNRRTASVERGTYIQLKATTSNGSAVTWKSNKTSVATVSDNGLVITQKPGSATITATADGTQATFKVTVKKPTITLSKTALTLKVDETYKLKATVSSRLTPTFTSSKSSVASVEDDGTITAWKKGTAQIRCKLDGVTKICKVTVVAQ
jgi:uncharacterized protein YjdB